MTEKSISALIANLPAPADGKAGWPWQAEPAQMPASMPGGQRWPRISVTVPSFNQGEYLEETLRSLLMQGYPDLEIFVMDGGSQDSSLSVLEAYAPWLTSWEAQPDRGQSHAINKGWQCSTGDLIAYLNSDDLYLPGALQKAAAAWNWAQNIALIVGGIVTIAADSTVVQTRKPRLKENSPLDLSLLDIADWYLPQQAAFFSRAALEKAGCWLREDLHYVMDRELFYRLCQFGGVKLLDEALAADRAHPQAKRQKDTLVMYNEDRRAMEYCDWGGEEARSRRLWVARQRLAQGYRLAAENADSRWKKIGYTLTAYAKRPAYFKGSKLGKAILNPLRAARKRFYTQRKEKTK